MASLLGCCRDALLFTRHSGSAKQCIKTAVKAITEVCALPASSENCLPRLQVVMSSLKIQLPLIPLLQPATHEHAKHSMHRQLREAMLALEICQSNQEEKQVTQQS